MLKYMIPNDARFDAYMEGSKVFVDFYDKKIPVCIRTFIREHLNVIDGNHNDEIQHLRTHGIALDTFSKQDIESLINCKNTIYENTLQTIKGAVADHKQFIDSFVSENVRQCMTKSTFVKEFLSITLGFPRQTGKTHAIFELVGENDLIVFRDSLIQANALNSKIITPIARSSNLHNVELFHANKQYDRIWFDECAPSNQLVESIQLAKQYIKIGTF